MKRLKYILLISAAALAVACGKHIPQPDQPDSPSLSRSYIFFDQEVMDCTQTKTAMVEGDKLPSADGTAFGVMGYVNGNAIFNNATYHLNGIAKVQRNGAGYDKSFTYQGLVQWTDATSTHNFYAFYPYKFSNLISVGNDQMPYIRYAQATTTDKMDDILTASAAHTKQPIVTLTFEHRLWALDITAKNIREHKDSLYNAQGGYDLIDPVIKIKNIKVEIDEIPATGNIFLDGTVSVPTGADNLISMSKTIAVNKSFNPGADASNINGADSFLFLPCGSFKYRLTIEFENALGLSYTTHHPATFVVDEEGEPVLADGQIQWDWATAMGPDRTGDSVGDGFLAGKRYTLDIVKDDYEVEFVWKETQWGEWNELTQEWESIDVEHTFE